MKNLRQIADSESFYYARDLSEKIVSCKSIVIYGAGIVAREVTCCLTAAPYNCKIDAYIVTSKEGNPDTLLGGKVVALEEGQALYKDSLILVAVLERYLNDILETLAARGFLNVIPLSFESDLWSELRGNYFRNLCRNRGKKFLTLEQELPAQTAKDNNMSDAVHVYMARCHLDKYVEISEEKYGWEIPIQVGADLTNARICPIRDNVGDNISNKNKEYCELTALYWIWKNDNGKYVGLCHYRRHFVLNSRMLAELEKSDIDVVLTIPILNFPSVRDVYAEDHFIGDWEIMLEAIKTLCPEYFKVADELQNDIYYYAYNMFIARKEIMDCYCEWLFPILSYCEERCKKKDNVYQNRFIGFLAERLLSVFFLHNESKWKIVHAEKNFIS